jgi:hypothetical protein
MRMIVGERRFDITLENTDAARAFAAQLPLTPHMASSTGTGAGAWPAKRADRVFQDLTV